MRYWLCYHDGDCDGDCDYYKYHAQYYYTYEYHYHYYLQALIQCPLGQGAESSQHLVRWVHFFFFCSLLNLICIPSLFSDVSTTFFRHFQFINIY